MGSTIPSVSTNSGGDATNQLIKRCNPLRPEDLCCWGLVRLTLLALLGREGTPVGVHRSRVKYDRPYVVLLPFVGEGLGKARQAELGGAVSRGVRPAFLASHRRDVDNRTAARLTHMGERGLAQEEGSAQVDRQRAVPALHCKLLDRARRVSASGVDQHVYAAELLHSSLDGRRGLLLLGKIRG